MKTNETLSASVQPPAPVRGIRKKILIFTDSCDSGLLLAREIKNVSDEAVIQTADDLDLLVHEIASKTPHLLVAHLQGDPDSNHKICDSISHFFPDLPICLLQGELSELVEIWKTALQISLAQPIRAKAPQAYAEGSRYVLHDESFHAFCKGKLNRPQQEPGWEKICSRQEARFILQLQTARKNHEAAKQYFQCLSIQQAGLDQEIAYRLVHGSYKALSWSRNLVAKWLALLAHYVPDVELEFLPVPGTPGPKIDYVHHDMPIEGVYAATLILSSAIKPSLAEAIKRVVIARFEGQNDDDLLALSLTIYGLAKLLQQVGTVQIELMDAWMHPSIVIRKDESNIPRGEHRNAGIFRDFYDFGFIVASPEPLASILRGFHNGTTYVRQERFLPSFSEFRRICRSAPGNSFKNVAE